MSLKEPTFIDGLSRSASPSRWHFTRLFPSIPRKLDLCRVSIRKSRRRVVVVGQKRVEPEDSVLVKPQRCSHVFRLTWHTYVRLERSELVQPLELISNRSIVFDRARVPRCSAILPPPASYNGRFERGRLRCCNFKRTINKRFSCLFQVSRDSVFAARLLIRKYVTRLFISSRGLTISSAGKLVIRIVSILGIAR